MGGDIVLRKLRAIEINGISVLYQREQSERPEGPWIPSAFGMHDDALPWSTIVASAAPPAAR
jgi:hypothetical protein